MKSLEIKKQSNSKGKQKLFYKVLAYLRKGITKQRWKYNGWIRNNGWREAIFSRIIAHRGRKTGAIERNKTSESTIRKKCSEGIITLEEIIEAIKGLKNSKAPKHDKVTAQIEKYMGRKVTQSIIEIFDIAKREKLIPRD